MTSVVIVAAHGSRANAANDAHRVLVEAIAESTSVPVAPAFLELAQPSIPAAIDGAASDGADRVLVLPYFLHPGRHLADDLTGIVDEANERHRSVSVELLGLFGADPGLAALAAAQIEASLRT